MYALEVSLYVLYASGNANTQSILPIEDRNDSSQPGGHKVYCLPFVPPEEMTQNSAEMDFMLVHKMLRRLHVVLTFATII